MPCVNLTGLVLFVLCAFALSVERLVVSVERGVWSQWREACALSGERRVLSVERGLCSQWREAGTCVHFGYRIGRDWLDARGRS